MVHTVTTKLWRFKLPSGLKSGRKVSSLFSRKGQSTWDVWCRGTPFTAALKQILYAFGHTNIVRMKRMSEVSIRGWDWMRAEQGSLLCHIFSSGCLNEVVSCRTGRGEVRLSASLWYLEADHESWAQTKAFCASSWFSVEWRFVCQLRIEVAYEFNVMYFTHVTCEWILVLCWGLYKESKRKWLIKQHTKELKSRRKKGYE